jgi:hypothetical protein
MAGRDNSGQVKQFGSEGNREMKQFDFGGE